MAVMPARYVSARYVGREDAFGRLAAVLDDAAHGRRGRCWSAGPRASASAASSTRRRAGSPS